jgi:hypothetical protein
MKKIFCIFMAIALCLSLCACGGPESIRSSDTLFEVVARYSDCSVLRNKETNVLYVNYDRSYGMSVLLNADGTPMVWSGR